MLGVVMTSPSSEIGPGLFWLAVVKVHHLVEASPLRVNVTPSCPFCESGWTLVGSMLLPSKRTPMVPPVMSACTSWLTVSV